MNDKKIEEIKNKYPWGFKSIIINIIIFLTACILRIISYFYDPEQFFLLSTKLITLCMIFIIFTIFVFIFEGADGDDS